jgi:hypothetical protein
MGGFNTSPVAMMVSNVAFIAVSQAEHARIDTAATNPVSLAFI